MSAALVVVDFQNDFCSPRGKGAPRRGDLSRVERAADGLERALARARRAALPVIFLRFLGDRRFQTPAWRARDRAQGKAAKCLRGSWGADFFRLRPASGERVFEKPCRFDPFLDPAFEKLLRRLGVERLILGGVYLDVCVDSAARGAFQRGLAVTVLSDAVASLHYPKASVLAFMKRYYGARVETSSRFGAR